MPPTVALYDTAALRAIEVRATALLGGDAFALMQRAGTAAWRNVLQHWPDAQRLLVVCGPGNNGGDGYVLATQAQQAGREVRVVRLPEHDPRTVLAQRACAGYLAAGGTVDSYGQGLPDAGLVIDALFGIGLNRAPDPASAQLIAAINAHPAPVLALDTPSGVDAERGAVPGVAVRAMRTVQLIAPHCGLATAAALDHVGGCTVATLELPTAAFDCIAPSALALSRDALRDWLPARRRDSHKGASGHVLCVGGDHGSGGAIVLAAEAALRCGAGLVSVATRTEHVPALLARRPEAMAHAVEDMDALRPLLARADVVALGPGLGQQTWGRELFDGVLRHAHAVVLDADALNLLANAPRELALDTVLTPHPGEAARLLGTTTAEVQGDRYAAARELTTRFGCVVV